MVKLVTAMGAATALLVQVHAQTMSLGGGTMTIIPGTTVIVEGSVTWEISPTGQVVNNGTIDLGANAVIDESPGAPVTGTGTERAMMEPGIPLQAEPGGLGLRFTNNGTPASLTLVRGHVPYVADNGEQGIARWFMVEGMTADGGPWDVVMAYDDTELNGAQETALQVYTSPEPVQGWTMLASILDEVNGTLSFSTNGPLAYVTAFAGDPSTGWEPEQPVTLTVRQDIGSDQVFFQCSGHQPGAVLLLYDATGRAIARHPLPSPRSQGSFSTGHLSGGIYLMHVEGAAAVKILRP